MFGLGFDNGCFAEGHRGGCVCEVVVAKIKSLNVEKRNMPRFSTLKNVFKVETLAASGGIF